MPQRADKRSRGWVRIRSGPLGAGAIAVLLVLGMAGTASAVPPPPPNPSDAQLQHSEAHAHDKAVAVGKLTNQVAAAQAKLQQLAGRVELKEELANKALVDLQRARDAAHRAETEARVAKAQAEAASERISNARKNLDEFAESSYEQGSTVGSVSAFIGSDSPSNVLERAQLLNAVSGAKLHALQSMQRARTAKANKDSAARAALRRAKQKRAEAGRAKRQADAAKRAAVRARGNQREQTAQLTAQQSRLEDQLRAARGHLDTLQAQRANYSQWLEKKKAEEAAKRRAARQAATSSSSSSGSSSSGGSSAPVVAASTGSVSGVIARARSVLGTPYAWGGGNAYGPTHGIHDGGVADAHGDYLKIGFDCSGLMVYAFAAAGVSLPHYSGYQYYAGSHVPLSAIQPGDMLFWSFNGAPSGIHHVALYIGNGMMIEAPYSGSYVRIVPVRYGGIMSYAARVL